MKNRNHGFTLLEILLVVGVIALLAGIVIIAINPSRQLSQTRDAERKSDTKQLDSAMNQFYIDKGYYPASSSISTAPTEVCDTGGNASTSVDINGNPCGTLVNLSYDLVPRYLTAVPADPQDTSTTSGSGYFVTRHSGSRILISAPNTELNNSNIPSSTYTVVFDSQNGTPEFSTTTDIISGATVTLPTPPTKTGYTFDSWNTQADGNGSSFDESTPVTDNTTVYAKWNDNCSHTPTDPDCWSIQVNNKLWGPMSTITNATSTTNGKDNTAKLYALNNPGYQAANYCYTLNEGDVPDGTWYLPAKDELSAAWGDEDLGPTVFPSDYYWSSTEWTGEPAAYSWDLYTGDGYMWASNKDYDDSVRCLR